MKILVLILASDTSSIYLEFQQLWRKYMNKFPEADCFFYKGHPDIEEDAFLGGDTLMIKINENLDTVYEKTLRAFDFFNPKLDSYDFVFRTNLSSFIDIPKLINFAKTLPKENCCSAVSGGLGLPEEEEVRFPGGSGILLSSDLVRRLIHERPEKFVQDDVTIGKALRDWKIPIVEFLRPDYLENGSWYLNNWNLNLDKNIYLFSYRLKSNDRVKDVEMMKQLIQKYHGV